MPCLPSASIQQLQDAERAYHDLVTGKAARVVVDQNGERVEFVSANRTDLYRYIQELRAQLNVAAGGAAVRGPAGVFF